MHCSSSQLSHEVLSMKAQAPQFAFSSRLGPGTCRRGSAAPAGHLTRSTLSSSSMRRTAASIISMAAFPAPTGCRRRPRDRARQLDRDGKPLPRTAARLGRPDRQGRRAAGDRGAVGASAEPPLPRSTIPRASTRRPRHHPRPLASLLPGADADRRRRATTSSSPGPIPAAWSWAIMTAPVLPMWEVAKKYVLADNFFQGAFGGSFLNHSCSSAPARPIIPMPTPARPRPRSRWSKRMARR